MSFRSSLSMKPSRFWSMSVKACNKSSVTGWRTGLEHGACGAPGHLLEGTQGTPGQELLGGWAPSMRAKTHFLELLDLRLLEVGKDVGRRPLGPEGPPFLLLCLPAGLR